MASARFDDAASTRLPVDPHRPTAGLEQADRQWLLGYVPDCDDDCWTRDRAIDKVEQL